MSDGGKSTTQTTLTILTGIVGLMTAIFTCSKGGLEVVKLQQDIEKPKVETPAANNATPAAATTTPAAPVTNANPTTDQQPAAGGNNAGEGYAEEAEPAPPPRKPAGKKTTSVQLVYTGDQYGCSLPITVTIGGRTFQPQGNAMSLPNVPLGEQNYTIQGNIMCPGVGNCTAYGEGSIDVYPNATFYVGWNANYTQCNVWLYAQ